MKHNNSKVFALTNKVNNTIRNTQRARSLHTTAQLNNLGLELARGCRSSITAGLLRLEPGKVLLGKVDEAGADILANEVCALRVDAIHRDLDLQLASAKAKIQDRLAAARLAVNWCGIARQGVGARADLGAHTGLVLLDLVVACDTQVDLALTHKGWDVGGGEEDECDGEVLDEGDVEAVLAAELYVGALEEVECSLLQAALCDERSVFFF